jgi:4-hydroxybenzoate polyprenyltransferase
MPGLRLKAAVQAARPRQWIKNVLLFVPLLLAHEFGNVEKLTAAAVAFLALSCCASAVYISNDLVDVDSDRRHPVKRRRPFASGALPVSWGVVLALLALAAGLALGWRSSPPFFGMLLAYIGVSTLYSLWLKQVVVADVLVLSGLYTLRIVAGGAATNVPVSEWLMAFSVFLFVSLAFSKRYSELVRLTEENGQKAHGRGYLAADWSLLESIGPTNGYLAVLVFALYIHSEERVRYYANGWALWMICPLLIYWISWIWIKAKRRELSEDPVLFAVTDRVSLTIGMLIAVFVAVSRPL